MSERQAVQTEAAFIVDALVAEAEAVRRVSTRVAPELPQWERAISLIEACRGHVVVAGLGKSGLVGQKISATLASLGAPSHFVHPSEAVHGDLGRIRAEDVGLLLSYSGETDEVMNLALLMKADRIPLVGISSNANSSLGRTCDAHLSIGDIAEACPHNLAPTATTTAMLAVGDTLALAVARRRNFAADDFHRRHPGGMLGAGLKPVTEVLRFRVGENLPVVSESLTVSEALAAAGTGRRAGAIVLVDAQQRLSGIFTDGDLRRLINRLQEKALEQPIRAVMTSRPRTLTVDAQVRDAVRMVQEQRLDEIPVVDGAGKPVGLIDVQDLVAMRVVQD